MTSTEQIKALAELDGWWLDRDTDGEFMLLCGKTLVATDFDPSTTLQTQLSLQKLAQTRIEKQIEDLSKARDKQQEQLKKVMDFLKIEFVTVEPYTIVRKCKDA